MDKMQPETSTEVSLPEKLDPANQVFDDILDIYPFLTAEEEQSFREKATGLLSEFAKSGEDQLEVVTEVIKLLDNPHAKIKPLVARSNKASETMKPTWEISGRALFIDIPSWDPRLETIATDLTAICRESAENYDAIVIDLRENGGGGSGKAYKFASIFFDQDVTYGRFVNRVRGDGLDDHPGIFRPETDFHAEWHTDVPIAILISEKTCSSSELFLALFKSSGRAMLIGEKTSGGSGNPVREEVKIGDSTYSVFIPTWRFFLAGKDKPIEETAIEPDIEYNNDDIKEYALKCIRKVS